MSSTTETFPWTSPPTRASMAGRKKTNQRKAMNNSVLAQLAALPEQDYARAQTALARPLRPEPPPYNKPFLVKRLAYRMQELAYGGSRRARRRS